MKAAELPHERRSAVHSRRPKFSIKADLRQVSNPVEDAMPCGQMIPPRNRISVPVATNV